MFNMLSLVQSYLHVCEYQKNLDEKTIKAYRCDLKQFSAFINEKAPSRPMIQAYIDSMHTQYKPKTVKRKIASLKAYFNYMESEELIKNNPFYKLKISYKEALVLPRTVPLSTLEQLLQTMYRELRRSALPKASYKVMIRWIAVIELLFASGMRISELCGLREHDVDLVDNIVHIFGKGSRERIMQIENPAVIAILSEYRTCHREAITSTAYFFVNRLGRRLSDQSVRIMLNHWTKKASISQHITPHMIRHSFATLLLEEDVDIRYIQKMLGHSSITTTQIYTHVAMAKQKQILSTKHPRNKMAF